MPDWGLLGKKRPSSERRGFSKTVPVEFSRRPVAAETMGPALFECDRLSKRNFGRAHNRGPELDREEHKRRRDEISKCVEDLLHRQIGTPAQNFDDAFFPIVTPHPCANAQPAHFGDREKKRGKLWRRKEEFVSNVNGAWQKGSHRSRSSRGAT